MDFIDYYDILGVAPDADEKAIKQAYRKLARKFHPDVSDEPSAEQKFKEVAEAYRVLKDADRRREFDELRAHGGARPGGFEPPPGWKPHSPGGGFNQGFSDQGFTDQIRPEDMSEFFSEMFGNRFRDAGPEAQRAPDGRGQDRHAEITIPVRDAFAGTRLPLTLRVPVAQASGQVEMIDKTLQVSIPAGVIDGRKLRLRGQGAPGIGTAKAGDLYIEIHLAPDASFTVDGRDVSSVVSIMPWQAALGASITIETLGGEVALKVPAGSRGGQKLRLRGRGFPGDPPGDHHVLLRIDVPAADSDEKKALYEQMRTIWEGNRKEEVHA